MSGADWKWEKSRHQSNIELASYTKLSDARIHAKRAIPQLPLIEKATGWPQKTGTLFYSH